MGQEPIRVVFLGTGDIAIPAFRALLADERVKMLGLVTQPDRPSGRRQELTAPEIKRVAEAAGVPVFQPERLRLKENREQLEQWEADVAVVMAYGQILSERVLAWPKRWGCINLHASLLPKFRGAAPIHAAILAGEQETGITVMYMDKGVDTGDILLQKTISIGERETTGKLHDRLALTAAEACMEALDALRAGEAARVPQDHAKASHCGKLTREDGQVNWNEPAEGVDRRVRAMNPWPAAFTTFFQNERVSRLKVYTGKVVEGVKGDPGEVVGLEGDGMIVACGENGYCLQEVQPEGKRVMTAAEFARGRKIELGWQFHQDL